MRHNKIRKLLVICLLITAPAICFADRFSFFATYDVCFTPGSDCAGLIISEIKKARKNILVQVYSFTDVSIANALIEAKKRGVEVKVVLDKSQIRSKYSVLPLLNKNKIELFIDKKPAIAHSKVIIVDERVVLGGSYNYTQSAAKRNSENVAIIRDRGFVKKYVKNWYKRMRESVVFNRM